MDMERTLSLWRSKQFSDVKFVLPDGSVIALHKFVLAAASPFFEDLFTSHKWFSEFHIDSEGVTWLFDRYTIAPSSDRVKLTPEVMEQVFGWIYGHQATWTEESVRDVLETALFFECFEVVRQCGKFIRETTKLGLPDAKLILKEDGGVFPVHKTVLGGKSSFFEKLFIWHKDQEEFEMQAVSSQVMQHILDWMYEYKITWTEDQVTEVLKTADYLDCTEVVWMATNYLLIRRSLVMRTFWFVSGWRH